MIKKKNKNLKTWPIFISFFISILSLCLIFSVSISYAKEPITVGKGIWINIWNYPDNPDMFCEQLKSKGINAIYLQISRSNMPAIKDPIKV